MKDDPLKFALIGCGNMGNYYAYNISKMKDAEIVSCCDPSESKLNSFKEKWNIPTGATNWKKLIPRNNMSEIDGVINCSLDSLHGEVFEACTEAEIPLLTEKPFAVPFKILNSFSPEYLIKQKMLINFSKRSIPAVAGALNYLREVGLGKIHGMELHYRQGWVLNHDYGDWHNSSAWFWRLCNEFSNHGVLGDLGSHLFDLATCFCGPVETLFCTTQRIDKDSEEINGHKLDSPDDAQCLLQMHNGANVLVNTSRTAAGEKDCLEILICAEKGSIKIMPEADKNSYEVFLISTGKWETIPCTDPPEKNLKYFTEQIKSETIKEYPGIKDAIYNHVLIEAAASSAQQDCSININTFAKRELGEIWLRTVNPK